ncbi:hypothetical protein L841_2674 [Mycobacterium sp. MAC_080597_8934]|nr:hypothetical protein L841_2674 [Mycobacterium sp. MAC_080597_8934]
MREPSSPYRDGCLPRFEGKRGGCLKSVLNARRVPAGGAYLGANR